MTGSKKLAQQRVERGWDDTAYWDTGSWIARNLGEILLYTAENLPGHPPDISFKKWRKQHRKAGKALLFWNNVRDDFSNTSEEQREKAYADAKKALRWVADNLNHLWT